VRILSRADGDDGDGDGAGDGTHTNGNTWTRRLATSMSTSKLPQT